MAKRSTAVITMHESIVGDVRRLLYVLLARFRSCSSSRARTSPICCSRENASRKKDVASRVALGASGANSRGSFHRECGARAPRAVLGLGVAKLFLKVLITLGPQALPVGTQIPIDFRVMLALLGAR
jgi:hypothetical protein